MWKIRAVPLVAIVAILVIGGWLSLATADDGDGQDQTAPRPAVQNPDLQNQDLQNLGNDQAPDNEIARRAAKEFAPWIRAIVEEKINVANRIFPMRRAAQDMVSSPVGQRIVRKFPKLDGLNLALIGGRGLGEQTGVLLFTVTTENGPVAFKIYHYRFGDTRSVGRVEITDDWMETEHMYLTVDPLPSPVIVPL